MYYLIFSAEATGVDPDGYRVHNKNIITVGNVKSP